jgi:very-short-patch-repair endonuclease
MYIVTRHPDLYRKRRGGKHPRAPLGCVVRRFANGRLRNPTTAEVTLDQILNSLNGGVLRHRFRREHVISGKWIVDFYFPEIRLAIEVDGSVHDDPYQKGRDREKDQDCARLGITMLRIQNREIFGDRNQLVKKLRESWRKARSRRAD